MADTIERLNELLDLKDAELEEATEENDRLERELEGSLNGWRRTEEFPDDDINLPVPRLEIVYVQIDEWRDFKVIYRLVTKHLLGHLVGTPFSQTDCRCGSNVKPDHLPYRDGAHAAHDAAHLQLPLFRVMPGEKPARADLEHYDSQMSTGLKHRRSA